MIEYKCALPQSAALNVLHSSWSDYVPRNIIYAIRKQALVNMSNTAMNGLIHSPYKAEARSHMSTIGYLLNLFLALRRMYTQKILIKTM